MSRITENGGVYPIIWRPSRLPLKNFIRNLGVTLESSFPFMLPCYQALCHLTYIYSVSSLYLFLCFHCLHRSSTFKKPTPKARVGWFERIALKHVYYHMWNRWPVQVWCMRVLGAGALGWPWGMGWGRKGERASGWGTHRYTWLIHVNVWQNHYNTVK